MPKNSAQQQEGFFRWFAERGIHSFDVQLRKPEQHPSIQGEKKWTWLRPSSQVSTGEYFLKFAAWVRYMNMKGCDAFIRPHGEGQHRVVFLDDLSIKRALQVASKYSACVVCTSENNTQVWLSVDRPLSKSQRKSLQSYLSPLIGSDRGSVSGDHLGRICGVKSQKRDAWVQLLEASTVKDYMAPEIAPLSPPLGGACVSPRVEGGSSQSEKDFGWVIGQLRSGVPPQDAIRDLALSATRRGKRQPELYAKRTVEKAIQVI